MRDGFRHKGHLLRVAGLFLGGLLAFLVLQAALVPKDFGVYGHYRAGALQDVRERPLVHAGRAACVECHTEAAEAARGGRHERIRCEACHGPLGDHAQDPSAHPGVKPDPRVLCARCHETNAARPAGFPQVDTREHAGGEACASCHAAHDPLGDAKGKTP